MPAVARPGTVYVAETPDDEDIGRVTGRFDAHWESEDDGSAWTQGPRGATLQEAVAWGRRQADVVLVTIGGEYEFSAGATNPEPERYPALDPSLSLAPRPTGTPFDGSVQTGTWMLSLSVRSTTGLRSDVERVADALVARAVLADAERSDEGDAIMITGTASAPGLVPAFKRTHQQSMDTLIELMGPEALKSVVFGLALAGPA
jgi:hypothetical protein